MRVFYVVSEDSFPPEIGPFKKEKNAIHICREMNKISNENINYVVQERSTEELIREIMVI